MPMRQVLEFVIDCDGYTPKGKPCPCLLTIKGFSQEDASSRATAFDWYQDHRGWICNAEHRGDSPT